MSTFRDRDQVNTVPTTTLAIMRSREFRIGVDEVRAGQRPNFDAMNSWAYERGRLWATIAPLSMDPRSLWAVWLYNSASDRNYII
jgi:hypothetical protein